MGENKVVYLLKKVLLQLFILILTACFCICIPPLFLIFLLPIYTFRFFIFKTSWLFRPDLGKMLTAMSSVFVVKIPFVYQEPINTLLVYALLEDHGDIAKFQHSFQQLLQVKVGDKSVNLTAGNGVSNTNSGTDVTKDTSKQKFELLYGEFQQYVTSWMGFFFWKQDADFNISNHIKYYSDPEFETSDKCMDDNTKITSFVDLENNSVVANLCGKVLKKPFVSKRSPWEFLIVHNYKRSDYNDNSVCANKVPCSCDNVKNLKKQTLVIFRLNHALADGYSLFHFVLKHAQMNVKQAQPNFNNKNKQRNSTSSNNSSPTSTFTSSSKYTHSIRKALNTIFFPIRAPYETTWQMLHCYDKNDWHIPEGSMARDSWRILSDNLDVQIIKDIKNHHNASFAGVVLTALAGGIQKTMTNYRDGESKTMKSKKIPKQIHCLTPLPLPNHTEKLRNYMTACFVKIPLNVQNANERLAIIEKNIQGIKDSTMLQTNFFMHKCVGGLFNFLIEKSWKPLLCTSTLSSFAGPENQTNYLGYKMIDSGFMGNVDVGNLGVHMTLFTYNGSVRMCLSVDKNILKEREQAELLKKNIMEEFHTLFQEVTV